MPLLNGENAINKPNFIVIGTARAGTTSLHKYLECHPDIYLSQIKELNFFSNPSVYEKGMSWYLKNFRTDKPFIGEASTSYSVNVHSFEVPQKIYQDLGDIKIIYILRDPIDRLLSHYMHHIHRGEVEESLSEIIQKKTDPIVSQGRYLCHIKNYRKYFSHKNILVLTIDELKNMPQDTMEKVYNFIGASTFRLPATVVKFHNNSKNSTIKNSFGKWILKMYHTFVEQRDIPYVFKKIFLYIAEIDSKKIRMPILTTEQLNSLIEYYKNDVLELEQYYQLDISNWRIYK